MSTSRPPTLIFLSVHKGASSLLTSMLAPTLVELSPGLEHLPFGQRLLDGEDAPALPVRPCGQVVTRVYPGHFDRLVEDPVPAGGRFADKTLVLVRRDPRDAAVSLYFSAAHSHPQPPGDASAFLARRQRLRELGPLEGIRRDTAGRAIAEFRTTQEFLRRHPQTFDAPYELLVTDADAWLDRVASHAAWDERIVAALRPVLRDAVQPPEHEDIERHRRRVRPGNWREVFDEALVDYFDREIGELMRQSGYAARSAPV